ncbi:hypothetical protein BN1708_018949, partial [Verticillium longisporum]
RRRQADLLARVAVQRGVPRPHRRRARQRLQHGRQLAQRAPLPRLDDERPRRPRHRRQPAAARPRRRRPLRRRHDPRDRVRAPAQGLQGPPRQRGQGHEDGPLAPRAPHQLRRLRPLARGLLHGGVGLGRRPRHGSAAVVRLCEPRRAGARSVLRRALRGAVDAVQEGGAL